MPTVKGGTNSVTANLLAKAALPFVISGVAPGAYKRASSMVRGATTSVKSLVKPKTTTTKGGDHGPAHFGPPKMTGGGTTLKYIDPRTATIPGNGYVIHQYFTVIDLKNTTIPKQKFWSMKFKEITDHLETLLIEDAIIQKKYIDQFIDKLNASNADFVIKLEKNNHTLERVKDKVYFRYGPHGSGHKKTGGAPKTKPAPARKPASKPAPKKKSTPRK